MLALSLSLLEKLLLSIIMGGIIGLEREHSKRQTLLGLRTFALISLLGMLLTDLSANYYYIASSIGLVGIFALAVSFYFFKATHFRNSLGLTTILMLPLTYILGMLISFNYIIEAIAATIFITYVLIEKGEVHHLVERISRREIVDFLIFGVIAFVIYPLIPSDGFDMLGHSINLQSFVLTVILISLLSFISHVIARVIRHNAVIYASFFGGLISSLATVMLFARNRKVNLDAIKLSFTSSTAGSVLRDGLLLMFLSLPLFRSSVFLFVIPLAGMLLITQYYTRKLNLAGLKFIYDKPISLFFVIQFALVLFLISTITNAIFDISSQLYLLSLLVAGAVNSASVIASVAFMFSSGNLHESGAINGIFLGLLGSTVAKLAVANYAEGWNNLKYILFLVFFSFVLLVIGFVLSNFYAF